MDNGPQFRVVQSEKLSEQVSRQLFGAIATGQYRAGDNLPTERQLAEIFQTSRVVIREALGSLAAKGIIDVRQGRGSTVSPMEQWNTLDPEVMITVYGDRAFDYLIEMRRIVEPELAALAAERITAAELEGLRAHSDVPENDTVDQHIERDTSFHLCLAQAAHNPVLLIMISSITELLRESRHHTYSVPGELTNARLWHRQILEAIETQDTAAARTAMAAHIEQVKGALQQSQIGKASSPPEVAPRSRIAL